MAEFNITADDLDRMARMAYLESGSIPVGDRVRDFQQVLGSMLTRGQLFANGMAGQGYGGLRSDQGGNTGYANTAIQRSLAAGNAYEPLMKFGNDLSKLPEAPQIYRELAAKYFADVLRDPETVNLHTDYGNPVIVKDRQGANWENHWLYGVSQNPDMVNGAGTPNQHAHGTMTGIKLPSSFNPGFDGGAQDWINRNKSIDGLTTDDAIQRMLDWANTPDVNFPNPGSDGFGDGVNAGAGVGPGVVSSYGTPYETADTGYGFSGSDVSSGVGPGFNNLGGAVPYGDVGRFAFGNGLNFGGGVGNGTFGAFANPLGYNAPGDGPGDALGMGNGMAGDLPAGFDPAAYLAQNRDVAASGMDAATHWRNFGAAEGRALAPPGWTQTQAPPAVTPTFGPSGTPTIGSGSTASTIGAPAASDSLPPFFSPVDYLAANGDLQALGFTPERAAQHFMEFGRHEVRALAPWLQASIYDAPNATATQGPGGLSPTYQPPQPTQTFGPDGSVSVVSTGLVPTQGPPDLTSTQGPGPTITARTGTFNSDEYLRANADVAASGQSALDHFRNYGAREGRAIDTLGNHFNGDAYLAQNRDVALAGLNPLEHFLRYGAQEARTLAPTDWASPLTATTDVGTYGAPAATQTIGPGGLTPTQAPPDLSPTFGPTGLTPTYSPPVTTPTFGPGPTMPSWSPFGGAGIGNAYNFSGANVGGGLGATNQSFSSFYPLDTNIGTSSGGSPGGGGISDYGFSGADVSGFDVNSAAPSAGTEAYSGPGATVDGPRTGTGKGSSSSAAFLADQAKTRAYWDSLVKPADLYGNTNTHTTPVITPVVPNLTTSNLALGAPGAMFGMFAPWR